VRTGTVIDLFGGIRGTVFAVLASISLAGVLVLGALYKLQGARLDSCTAKAGNYQATQDANGRTIDGLRANLSAAIKRNEADQKRAEEAGTAAEKRRNAIQAELAETQEALAHAYAKSPTARAWGTVGVDRDIADRLPRPR